MIESDLKIQVKLKVEKKNQSKSLSPDKLCNNLCTSFSSLFYAFRYTKNEILLPQMFCHFCKLNNMASTTSHIFNYSSLV